MYSSTRFVHGTLENYNAQLSASCETALFQASNENINHVKLYTEKFVGTFQTIYVHRNRINC